MNNLFYYVLAVIAGVMLASQSGINAQLRTAVGNPVIAALISFLVGTFFLSIYVLLFGNQTDGILKTLQQMSLYKWAGGLIGALYVTGVIIVAPRIGATNTAGLIVAGQILFALFLDHYGLLGFVQHSINYMRLAGALLLIAGVFLILKN
ncbi:DMT family transporter [Flavihumibacter sp. R14]|nr:DMT family transporter [Flavihumibacter soli]